ncbi:hypothetical protein, partial [Nonomuraea sp. NPDC049784]|uniref:hypothetical protein n=1 Tax=Nonomuraea sp. NPDC049784 TaxID=3154361 RepID=UPI0033D2E0EB
TLAAHAAHYTITVPPGGERTLLRLDLVGDVAVARVGDRTEDLYWNGTPWDIDISGGIETVEVMIYPLTPDTPVWLPEAARGSEGARILDATVIDHRAHPLDALRE